MSFSFTPSVLQGALKTFFPSWKEIQKNREVVLFTCGQMSNPLPLVDHVYEQFVEETVKDITDVAEPKMNSEFLYSLYTESAIDLPG